MKDHKKVLWFGIKVLISVCLLAVLLFSVNKESLLEQLKNVSIWAVLFSGSSFLLATVVNTARWGILLRMQDLPIPFWKLFSYNLAYAFYTVTLPGGRISAEGVRIYQIIRDHADTESRARATLCAVTDRVFALGSFVLIVCAFIVFDRGIAFAFSPLLFASLFLVVLAAAVFVFLPPSWLLAPVQRFFPGLVELPSISKLVHTFFARPLALGAALGASLVADLLFALGAYIPAHALGLPVSFLTMLFAFSVSMIAAFVPVTLAGIGLREGTLAYLLVIIAGATGASALSVSIVTLVSSLVVAALGAWAEFHYHFLRSGHDKIRA